MSDSAVGLNEGSARTGRPREFGKKQQNPVRRFGGIAIAAVLAAAQREGAVRIGLIGNEQYEQ